MTAFELHSVKLTIPKNLQPETKRSRKTGHSEYSDEGLEDNLRNRHSPQPAASQYELKLKPQEPLYPGDVLPVEVMEPKIFESNSNSKTAKRGTTTETTHDKKEAFTADYYRDALDPEVRERQLQHFQP